MTKGKVVNAVARIFARRYVGYVSNVSVVLQNTFLGIFDKVQLKTYALYNLFSCHESLT